MSQAATLQALDATLAAAFAGAGMADAGEFLAAGAAPGTDPTPCTVLVDRAAQFFDDERGIAGVRVVIALQRSEVADPQRTDTVTVGAEVFKLDQILERDESRSVWVVVNG